MSATSISNVAPAKTNRSVSTKGGGKNAKKRGGDVANFDPNVPPNERDEKNQLLSNQQIVEKILQIQRLAL